MTTSAARPPRPTPPAPADLVAHAAATRDDLAQQQRRWGKGFTRRRFLQGAGMAGVAALGTQLVTTRTSFAAADPTGGTPAGGNTVVVVFLRGGCDGLRTLVPNASSLGLDQLAAVRPALLPGAASLLPLDGAGGWALNGALAPVLPLWGSGELTFVPAVATSPSRSHFDAQRFLESGGAPTTTTGWLDRLLGVLGPGTTFRAVSEGYQTPGSMLGPETDLAMTSLADFVMPSWGGDWDARTAEAVAGLYRGLPGMLPADVAGAVDALGAAAPAEARTAARSTPTTTRSAPPWPTSRRCCAPRSGCRWRRSTSAAGTPTPTSPPTSTPT